MTNMINNIYKENCLNLMAGMEDNYVDHVITSPPYNMNGKKQGKPSIRFKYKEFNDDLTQEEYFNWTYDILTNLLRVTKKYVFYNIQMVSGNKLALMQTIGNFAGYIKEVIIWDKTRGEPAVSRAVMNSVWEFILVLSKEEPDKRIFKDMQWRGTVDNIIRIPKVSKNKYKDINRATFPDKLPELLINNFTQENDIIFDPFMGVGTTLLAAKRLNRRYIGSDLSEACYNVVKERLEV